MCVTPILMQSDNFFKGAFEDMPVKVGELGILEEEKRPSGQRFLH